MARRVTWFRVLGLGEISGGTAYAYLWSTETASGSWPLPSGCVAALTVPSLVEAPAMPSSQIGVLDAIGADGSLTVRIVHAATAGPAASLLRGPTLSVASGGGSMRLTSYTSPTATTLDVDDTTAVSVPALLWSGSQCFLATAKTATTLTVTRGACASELAAIPMVPLGSTYIGATVYAEAPSPIGLWCELGYSEHGGSAITVWRGVVEAVEVSSDRIVEVRARSILSALRDRVVTVPRASTWLHGGPWVYGYLDRQYRGYPDGLFGGGEIVSSVPAAGPRFYADASQWGSDGDARWTHCRVTGTTGKWVVIPCTYDGTVTPLGLGVQAVYSLQETYTAGEILQVGDADGVLSLSGRALVDHVIEVLAERTSAHVVEYANRQTGSASAVLTHQLTAREPAGWGGGLPTGWVDLSGLALSAGSTSLPVNTLDADAWIYPKPRDDGDKLIDLIADSLLTPLGYGIAADGGQIRGIDWAPDVRSVASSTGTGTSRGAGWRWARRGYDGGRQSVAIAARPTQTPRIVASGRADPLKVLRSSKIEAVGWSPDEVDIGGAIVQRQSQICELYSMVLPVLSLQVDALGGAYSVGTPVLVARPDLVTSDGLIGNPTTIGIVLERSRALGSDVSSLSILLTQWIDDTVAAWGPSGRVESGTATTAVIELDAFAGDDSAVWASVVYPDEVRILDADGAQADSGTATAYNAGTRTLTITGLGGAPSAGQIVVLGPYSTANVSNRTAFIWLAAADGTVGADAGYPWGI